MSTRDVEQLRMLLEEIRRDVLATQDLQRLTNGRVKALELWQARLQGIAITGKTTWLVIGGIVGAISVELITRSLI